MGLVVFWVQRNYRSHALKVDTQITQEKKVPVLPAPYPPTLLLRRTPQNPPSSAVLSPSVQNLAEDGPSRVAQGPRRDVGVRRGGGTAGVRVSRPRDPRGARGLERGPPPRGGGAGLLSGSVLPRYRLKNAARGGATRCEGD